MQSLKKPRYAVLVSVATVLALGAVPFVFLLGITGAVADTVSDPERDVALIIRLRTAPLGAYADAFRREMAPRALGDGAVPEALDALRDSTRARLYAHAESMMAPVIRQVSEAVQRLGGELLGHTPVLPAAFVRVPSRSIPAISDLPWVVAVEEDRLLEGAMDISPYAIGADAWWASGFNGGPWDLAVVDTGIDDTHPDLTVDAAAVFHTAAQGSGAYADDPTDPDDLHGHGTHIAGTVASVDTRYRGVANGLGKLINAKAGWLSNTGASRMSWSDAMEAIDWAVVTEGADVISFSFGASPGAGQSIFADYFDAVVDDLGVVAVICAGNSGPADTTVWSPGNAYNVLTVGNVYDVDTVSRTDDFLSSSSSHGPTADGRLKPDLSAPGTGIMSTAHDWETGPDFVSMTGTSMATPHVASSVLLLMSDRGLTFPGTYKALLLNSAEDWGNPGPDTGYGWGYLNLNWALAQHSFVREGVANDTSPAYFRGALAAGARATLVWQRHSVYEGPSYPSVVYALNDLDLLAYDEATNSVFASSTSALDNVEHIVAPGPVGSAVYKVVATGPLVGVGSEPFALATASNFPAAAPPVLAPQLDAPATAEIGAVFQVNVTVRDAGDLMAHGVTVTLSNPPGTTIIGGANPQDLGVIAAGMNATATWLVRGDTLGTAGWTSQALSFSYDEWITGASAGSTEIVDSVAPTSTVDALPPDTFTTAFTVNATAVDIGLGVDRVELFYRHDGGPWTSYGVDLAAPWSWMFDTVTSGDGLYEFYSISTDVVGNVEMKTPVVEAWTRVAMLPASTVDSLPAFTGIAAFPVQATTNVPAAGIALVELFFRKDGGSWTSHGVDGAAPWSWAFDTGPLGGDGLYEFYSVATDGLGTIEDPPTSPDAGTVVDTLPPGSAVDALPPYSAVPQITVAATASDLLSGVALVELLYRKDGGAWTSAGTDTAAPWEWNFDTGLTGGDGYYEFYSVARDSASNAEAAPPAADAGTTVDTAAPSASVSALPTYHSSLLLVVSANATDTLTAVVSVELFYRFEGGAWTSSGTDLAAPWAWTLDTLAIGGDGAYDFQAVAVDSAGNVEPVGGLPEASTTVDTTAPTSGLTPLPPLTNAVLLSLDAMASDATSGVDHVTFTYRKDGGTWSAAGTDTTAPWAISFDASLSGDGFYEFFTLSYDRAGNAESKAQTAEASTRVDTTPPVATVASLPPYSRNLPVSIVVSASDTLAGVASVEVHVRHDGGAWTSLGSSAPPGTRWFNVTGVEGLYEFQATALDAAGNAENLGPTEASTVADLTPPVVTLRRPTDGTVLAPGRIEFAWNASDALSGIALMEFRLDGGDFVPVDVDTYTAMVEREGAHAFTVRARDAAGNEAEATVSFRVESQFAGIVWILGIMGVTLLVLFLVILWRRRNRLRPPPEEPGERSNLKR